MKVTCGSCFRTLVVEDWLADNVARCPKCDEVIRVPAKGSPDGANAVVLTVDEATELLRIRANAGLVQKVGGQAFSPASDQPTSTGPKTEPLPAFLKHASGGIREEPEQRKTRPLPRPVGRASPGLGPVVPPPMPPGPEAAPLPPADGPTFSPQLTSQLTPLVPVAFVLGLLIGAVCGWWIARSGNGSQISQTPPGPENVGPAVVTTTTGPSRVNLNPSTSTTGTTEPVVAHVPPGPDPVQNAELPANNNPPPSQLEPAPQFGRNEWLAGQPKGARAQIVGDAKVVRRVAAIGGKFPDNNLYFPAPLDQVYLDIEVRLKRTTGERISFTLSGGDPGCWLVTQDRQIFLPMGSPVSDVNVGPADDRATVTLDDSNDSCKVQVRFLAPAKLPPTRLAFASSQFVDLAADALAENDPSRGRDLHDTAWSPIPAQSFAQDYADKPFMAALVANKRDHLLTFTRQDDGYLLAIDKVGIRGIVKPLADKPGCFLGTLKLGEQQAETTVRVFDACQTLLIYFGNDKFAQFGYQRHQSQTPW